LIFWPRGLTMNSNSSRVIEMGLFEEGSVDCVKGLLRPAERVLKEGLDIAVEDFSTRERLWLRVRENYDRYLEGECGDFLRDLDIHFRGKFEAALAILAWSFKRNGEEYPPAKGRYSERELEAVERVLRYNVFEIYSKEDVMKKILHRDGDVLGLLRDYYRGLDAWIDDVLNDPAVKLPLRHFLKTKWDSYKERVNSAIAEATLRFDWFRDFLMLTEEETEAVERMYRRRLEKAQRESEAVRQRMDELRRREVELRRREAELREREEEVSRKIKEVMALKGKVEAGSRFVRIDEARILEMNFVGRVRGKFRGEVKLLGKTFRVEALEERVTFDKGRFAGKLNERDLKNVPDNREVRILLREKKLFGKREEITIRALFYGRPERYAEVGFDTDPLELADVNAVLVDARAEAEKGRVILLIASPTGFERRVLDYISSRDFHRNFISENVSLVLLDLESGELVYNPHDEYARALEPMLRLERDDELMDKVREFLEGKLLEKGYVRLEEAAENFPEDIVKRAFQELRRERGYTTKYIEGVGYVLVREGFL